MAHQNIVSIVLSDELLAWIDSKRETEYGTLRRSDVIRSILEKAVQAES